MRDNRYTRLLTDQGFGDGFGKRFPSEDEAHASFAQRAEFADGVAGRRLSRAEILKGVVHPEPTRADHIAAAARRTRELSPPSQPPTIAEQRLKSAQKREEQSLPRERRAVIDAERGLAAERAETAKQEALAGLLNSPKAVKTLATIDRLLQLAMYDESVSQSDLDELRHQQTMLMTFGDSDAASVNVRLVQDRLFDAAKASADVAKSHHDKVSARRDALLAGRDTFDVEPVVNTDLLGSTTVTLTFAGDVQTVPLDQFSGRSTAELLTKHFGVTPPVTE